MSADAKKTFEISLCMSGAISAGAYTAGVVDFLVEALQAWEDRRQFGDDDVPGHRVVIRGLTGASAGGITAALTAVELAADSFPRSDRDTVTFIADPWRRMLPRLHDAWVVRPDMMPRDGRPGLFGVDDLHDVSRPVRSLLDGTPLDQIRDTAFQNRTARTEPVPFIAERMHIYMTLSNVRGVPYQIVFGGTPIPYGMKSHGDRTHYVITGIGGAQLPRAMGDLDAATGLTAGTLNGYWPTPLTGPLPPSATWGSFAEAAMSTGAFPIGLPPRRLAVDLRLYGPGDGVPPGAALRLHAQIPWEARVLQSSLMQPSWPRGYAATPERPIVNVDGGVIDNEPFETARMVLLRQDVDGRWVSNPRTPAGANRAVIAIDPFPEGPVFDPADDALEALLKSVLPRLLGMLVAQGRFKPSELIAAADEDVFSRYLVSPVRSGATGAKAIACGLLGGFGGFVAERLREHDYRLGRRNCQQFLREHFAVDAGNPIVGGNGRETGRMVPLVPLFKWMDNGTEVGTAVELPEPEWPHITTAEVDALVSRLRVRVERLIPRLGADLGLQGWRWQLALFFLKSRVTDKVLDVFKTALLDDLKKRGQM